MLAATKEAHAKELASARDAHQHRESSLLVQLTEIKALLEASSNQVCELRTVTVHCSNTIDASSNRPNFSNSTSSASMRL